MALNFVQTEQRNELAPRITVFGVGGAGGNAVNNMIEQSLEGVDFVVANTDAQALQQNRAQGRIQMGVKITEGLGAGARPSVGSAAAEETIEEIIDHLAGAHMCFITAGMGGGTGTGAAPIIAQAARELGVLTVGVVTKPFQFEGAKRMRQAEEGIEALQKVVDTLIIIPNQNLFRLANERTTFTEAFAMADDVLYQGVKGVTDLMVRPGLINLDFADVRAVMDEMGKAMMGTGEASGEDRAVQAAEKAIANPLLDEISLNGARGVLINITGGHDLTLFELDDAANRIREKVDPEANIIVGSTLDPSMEGMIRVSVVATGIDVDADQKAEAPRETPSFMDRAAAQPQRVAEPVARAPQPEPRPEMHPEPQARPEQPNLFASERVAPAPEPSEAYQPQPAPQRAYAPEPQRSRFGGQPAAHHPQPHPEERFDLDEVFEEPAPAPHAEQSGPSAFTAPRRAAPGTPSPETLARLQQAVQKAPEHQGGYARPAASGFAGRAAPVASRPAPQPEEKGGRFGIGSFISRMAGQSHDGHTAAARHTAHPAPSYEEEAERAHPDERIEIPAFLRRQAN
ncbi:MAG: cell division protein FtsZ [Roseibaca calidilacus]|uniref:Cell division protein FtsZ n=1 Tax=Roseibaca calidilacus TaxID=1666912 RepID=A0A0P7W560_9RHOB|nr:cell division protein FtsZ [Roseibaca calidilacus]KPP91840.1 MAG: cell division protein FtsZ [Roseibaca calidilacus]CUX82428.1 cell division protein FtsZ [Roseibaca calidilacus]